ncbi:hypothetical protein PPL_04522 [Heterostelium album PN500]|uniref:BTB domain-containing protein n=1 Tax=Heterostelium pallidum (strain ATCC 26659 / Pp 5 / PN500) TaxID=670386 RepID=D3B7T4_HETP5|nr:hypothetical protein PPL_04522 [Heterostelium album PN500]EFA82827.1 hypothetical protein PPL_04522 [Heterostelium album PN500]|eukprot:XP_020434944.1 hypothetical protein PPL_04522 [Heterostelium album PN500]
MNGTINHIDSSFITSMRNESPVLSFIENVDRILNLTKSQYPQLQHTGMFSLSELTFQRFKYMVTVFAKFRSFTPILSLLASKEKKTRDIVISLLWNFSAEESLKIKMFDEGIFDYIFDNMDKLGEDQTLAISAIIQNLSEYRFERGHFQPILDFINEYHEDYQFPATFNWVTLQPHVPLLESKDVEVQSFVLYCINSFSSGSRYDRSLWKGLMENKGVLSLMNLTKSNNQFVSSLAMKISKSLGLGESSILVEDPEVEMKENIQNLYIQSLFTDFTIQCGSESFKIHKSICLARCPKLKDILKEQDKNIKIANDSEGMASEYLEVQDYALFEILREIFRFLYGFNPVMNDNTAKVIIRYASRLELEELKQYCEYYLWHYIDCDNAGEYLDIAIESGAQQLKKVASEFIIRNIGFIYNGNFAYYVPTNSPPTTSLNINNNNNNNSNNNNNNNNNNDINNGMNLENCKIESDEEGEDEPTSSNINNNNNNSNNIKKQTKWRGHWNDTTKVHVYENYRKFLEKQKKEIFQLNLEYQ